MTWRKIILFIAFICSVYQIKAQAIFAGSSQLHYVNYKNTQNFQLNNLSNSFSLRIQKGFKNNRVVAYIGLGYYTELTGKTCISFEREQVFAVTTYKPDEVLCEYQNYNEIDNINAQIGIGYNFYERSGFHLGLFIQNNIIVHEWSENRFDVTDNSPTSLNTSTFGKSLPTFSELYIIPTASFIRGKLYTDVGISIGTREFDANRTLLGIKASIGIKL